MIKLGKLGEKSINVIINIDLISVNMYKWEENYKNQELGKTGVQKIIKNLFEILN